MEDDRSIEARNRTVMTTSIVSLERFGRLVNLCLGETSRKEDVMTEWDVVKIVFGILGAVGVLVGLALGIVKLILNIAESGRVKRK